MPDSFSPIDAFGHQTAERDYLKLHRSVCDGRYDAAAHDLAAGLFGPDGARMLRKKHKDWRPGVLLGAFLDMCPTVDALYGIMASRTNAAMELMAPDHALRWTAPRRVAWGWTRIALGAVRLLETTGDERFAALLERAGRYLLDCRNGSLADPEVRCRATSVSPHGWISPLSGGRKECEYTTEITTTGLMLRPFLKYFSLRPPATDEGKRLREDVLKAGEALFAFHCRSAEKRPGHVQYLMPDGRPEALNHVSLYLAFLIELNRHLKRDDIFEHVTEASRVFYSSALETPCGGLAWPYMADMETGRDFVARQGIPGDDTPHWLHSERYWKSNATALLPLEMIRHGYPVPDGFGDRIAKTFLRQLMPAEYSGQGRICGRVYFPGNRCFTTPAKPWDLKFANITGWAEWSPLCPEILDRLTLAVAHRPDIFPDGWLTGYCPLMALAYKKAHRAG